MATDDSAGARRVIQVVTQRAPAGAQRVAHQLCQSFRARGIESQIYFLYHRAAAFEDENYEDLRGDPPGPVATVSMVIRLARILRSQRPDAVIGHLPFANAIASLAGFLARVPRRIVVHHVLAESEGLLRQTLRRVLRGLRITNTEVFVSHTTLDSFGTSARRHGVVIHNGVEVAPDGHHPDWSGDSRIDASRPLMLAVGRLADQKDHRTLIQAMCRIPEADLAIVGEGDLREELEALVRRHGLEGRVSLVGNIEPEQVPDALAAADLVVQPSRWEAFSMLVLEAMAARRAMVVSDIPSHREALGDAASFHRPGDPASLAAAAVTLLADASKRDAMAARAQERVASFTLDAMVDGYLELLDG